MKVIGWFAVLIGIVVAIIALNMDTSVATGFGGRVNNIGLMDERRNILIVASLAILVGVALLGFASLQSSGTDPRVQIGYRACPYCAEPVRVEAKVCKHCQHELPAAEVAAPVAPQSPTAESKDCFECAYYNAKGRWDKSVGRCALHMKRTYASDTCGDFSRKADT